MDPITDAAREECADFVPTPNTPYLLDEGEEVARLAPPLGLELIESSSGLVYVAGVIAGGAAEESGVFRVGDVINFCSVPFGDALCRVPDADGVEFIADQMQSRGADEGYMVLARTRAAAVMEKLEEDLDEDGVRLKSSIELQPLLAAIKDPETFVLLTPEMQAQFEREEMEQLRKQIPALTPPPDGLEGTAGDDGDALFHIPDDRQAEMDTHLREFKQKMEEQAQMY